MKTVQTKSIIEIIFEKLLELWISKNISLTPELLWVQCRLQSANYTLLHNMGHFRNKLWAESDIAILETFLFSYLFLSHSRRQVYDITVAPSLIPPGTLWKRLRNINLNDFKKVLDIHGIQHQKNNWSKEKINDQNAVSEFL